MSTTLDEINDAWVQFVEARKMEFPEEPPNSRRDTVSTETDAFEMAEDEYNIRDHLAYSGCVGDAHFPKNNIMTRIAGKGVTSRMLLFHRISSLDSREYVLFSEKQAYRNRLVQSNAYSAGVVDACVETFVRMCKKLSGVRAARKNISIGSTYYTLKMTVSPTIPEMTRLFGVSRSVVLKAIKAFRLLCFDDEEMRWVFTHEQGESNLYRFVNILELPWGAVAEVKKDLAERNLDPFNNHQIIRSIRRYMMRNRLSPVRHADLYKYICDKCAFL